MNAATDDISSIAARVVMHAQNSPDAIAIECRQGRLTYRELVQAAGGVAEALARAGVVPESVVAVEAARTLETPVALLGTLLAGCTYLPVDSIGSPITTQRSLARVKPAALLAAFGKTMDADGPRQVFVDLSASGSPDPKIAGRGDQIAYLMPTSGTSGTPKIVQVCHRNVVSTLPALATAIGGIDHSDAYLHMAPFVFSSSVRQLFMPLFFGAKVLLSSDLQREDPLATLGLISEHRATIVDVIPSVLSVLLDTVEQWHHSSFGKDIRLLLTASERLPGPTLSRWYSYADDHSIEQHVRVFNMYGQTETAGIISLHEASPADCASNTVPIGVPLPNTEIELVNADGSVTAEGEVGEIKVVGPSIAIDYFRDECDEGRATDGLSLRRPSGYRTGDLGRRAAGGELHYAGRTDSRVKIRGEMVDLGEVERTLSEHPAVELAIAADVTSSDGQTTIRVAVACRRALITGESSRVSGGLIVGSPAALGQTERDTSQKEDETSLYSSSDRTAAKISLTRASEHELIAYLASRLPTSHIPSVVTIKQDFPRTVSGKLDRAEIVAELRKPRQPPAVTSLVDDPYLRAVSQIWTEILCREVTPSDDFFSVGGDSLAANRVTTRLRKQFGIEISIRLLFDQPVLGPLADEIRDRHSGAEG